MRGRLKLWNHESGRFKKILFYFRVQNLVYLIVTLHDANVELFYIVIINRELRTLYQNTGCVWCSGQPNNYFKEAITYKGGNYLNISRWVPHSHILTDSTV